MVIHLQVKRDTRNLRTSGGFPAGSGRRLGQPHSQAPPGVRIGGNLKGSLDGPLNDKYGMAEGNRVNCPTQDP